MIDTFDPFGKLTSAERKRRLKIVKWVLICAALFNALVFAVVIIIGFSG